MMAAAAVRDLHLDPLDKLSRTLRGRGYKAMVQPHRNGLDVSHPDEPAISLRVLLRGNRTRSWYLAGHDDRPRHRLCWGLRTRRTADLVEYLLYLKGQ